MMFNYLCTYDLYGPVRNVFNAGRYITWGSEGLALRELFEKYFGSKFEFCTISLLVLLKYYDFVKNIS